MAESKEETIARPNSASPPPNCAICLGSFTNKCFSDSCMHQFCFKCLLEWSKIKAECPLCKQPFQRIIHNVKSNDEYDEHVVDDIPSAEGIVIDNEEYLFLPLAGNPQPPTRHHFHFRTTFTVDTRGEHAIQQMLLSHPLVGNTSQISIGGGVPRNIYHRRRRGDSTSTNFRRSIYYRNLWVYSPPDVSGRYREVSPSYFRNCPGARTRLVPWLNRELNALLYENTQLVMHLVDTILEHLLHYHICSRAFRNLLYEYLDNKTDHFIHEFYHFMRSPFDMIGYDRHISYTERPRSPLPTVVDLDGEASDDSDVIIVGATNPAEPVIIDLLNSDSDEPILVSHTQNTTTTPAPPQTESRPTVLPPKLRLKHKQQRSREKEQSSIRKRKRPRRHRPSRSSSSTTTSRSRSSSSSSSSTSTSYNSTPDTIYEEKCRKKYKMKKKIKKYLKIRPESSDTSDINVDSTSSDSDIPLSALARKKRQLHKYKKALASLFKPKEETLTRDNSNSSNNSLHLPSCSKFNPSIGLDLRTTSTAMDLGVVKKEENCLDLRTVSRRKDDLTAIPTCSRYTNNNFNNNSDYEGSNSHLITEQIEGKSKHKKRLRNICLKKEESTNMWYSYPRNYESDSSTN